MNYAKISSKICYMRLIHTTIVLWIIFLFVLCLEMISYHIFQYLNLRTNGLTYLIETYKNIISINKEYIIKNNKINWKIFRKINK